MLRLAALIALLVAPACGGSGNSDVCQAACSAKERCGAPAGDVATCRAECAAKPGCYSDQDNEENRMCTNAPTLREQKLSCYGRACGEIDTCVQPLVKIDPFNPLCQKN